jgi:hypothetical protein
LREGRAPAPNFDEKERSVMTEVSLWRLYLLRIAYLLLFVFLGLQFWPLMFDHKPWDLMHGVACSMFATLPVLALVGMRYPLQMLPLLFFEIVWKSIWLIAIALPLWNEHRIDADTTETVKACLMSVIFPIVIPWSYVWANYVRKPSDRWR